MFPNKSNIGFRVDIIVEPDGDGFHAYCPMLEGLHVGGDTEQEAVQNAKDAAIAYLESLIKHGDPIPLGIIMRETPQEQQYSTAKVFSHHTEELKVPCIT